VRRTRGDLRVDVGEHHVRLHDPELAVVDRHDRTMAAPVPAAAAGFRIAHQPPAAVGHLQCRVVRQWRQPAALRDQEVNLRQRTTIERKTRRVRGEGFAVRALRTLRSTFVISEGGEVLFELAAEHRIGAERSQPLVVQRRIQPEGADARRSVHPPGVRDDRRGQARRGVHRQVEGDEIGRDEAFLEESLLRHVDARDLPPRRAQPRRGRGDPEGLPAQFVRADEEAAHHG
jgi:hypothetical protein